LDCSSVFIASRNTPAPDLASQFANASWNEPPAVSGSSQYSAEVRRFSLHSQSKAANANDSVVSIFLAEDNPADVGLVRKAMEDHGITGELVVAVDGEIAIRFIEAMDDGLVPCPHLAIIDLNLPRRHGREVLARMRQSSRCGRIPVAILSSSDAEQDRSDAARLGASRYMRKPSLLDEFLGLGAIFKEMLHKGSE
jgi:CheY-like chemotaxis protein